MKTRQYFLLFVLGAGGFTLVLWLLWPAQLPQSVTLLLQTNYVAQSSNLASFYVSNAGPRAILLTDLIIETKAGRGWRGGTHSVPTYPQRLAIGEIKDLAAGVAAGTGPWRLRVAYGTDIKGPLLELGRAEYAISHLRWAGPGFGIMAGSNTVASPELGEQTAALVLWPEIGGSVRFSNQVYQALLLVRSRAPTAYAIVGRYVGRIQEGERSGMWAYRKPPTYEMSDKTAFYSVTWCAATIAHDSFHSKLYHDFQQEHRDAVPEDVWKGKVAEQQCMRHQIAVMRQIGAPQAEIDYALTQADGGYVKDKETWEDYQRRKW